MLGDQTAVTRHHIAMCHKNQLGCIYKLVCACYSVMLACKFVRHCNHICELVLFVTLKRPNSVYPPYSHQIRMI